MCPVVDVDGRYWPDSAWWRSVSRDRTTFSPHQRAGPGPILERAEEEGEKCRRKNYPCRRHVSSPSHRIGRQPWPGPPLAIADGMLAERRSCGNTRGPVSVEVSSDDARRRLNERGTIVPPARAVDDHQPGRGAPAVGPASPLRHDSPVASGPSEIPSLGHWRRIGGQPRALPRVDHCLSGRHGGREPVIGQVNRQRGQGHPHGPQQRTCSRVEAKRRIDGANSPLIQALIRFDVAVEDARDRGTLGFDVDARGRRRRCRRRRCRRWRRRRRLRHRHHRRRPWRLARLAAAPADQPAPGRSVPAEAGPARRLSPGRQEDSPLAAGRRRRLAASKFRLARERGRALAAAPQCGSRQVLALASAQPLESGRRAQCPPRPRHQESETRAGAPIPRCPVPRSR